MKITRLYTGDDGESHFEDIEIRLQDTGSTSRQSEHMKATGIYFVETDGTLDIHWRNAPRQQYVVILEGGLEMDVGDGTKRQFGLGDIFLAEDITGRGHNTRAANHQPFKALCVTLD